MAVPLKIYAIHCKGKLAKKKFYASIAVAINSLKHVDDNNLDQYEVVEYVPGTVVDKPTATQRKVTKLKKEIKSLKRPWTWYKFYRDEEIAKQNFGKAAEWDVSVKKYEAQLNDKEFELKQLALP